MDAEVAVVAAPDVRLTPHLSEEKRIPVYWSHCGSYRARYPELLGVPRVASYDDLSRLAEEVKSRGYGACKTNVMIHDGKTLAAVARDGTLVATSEGRWVVQALPLVGLRVRVGRQ